MAQSQIDYVMPFGKHKGKLVSEIYEEDIDYLKWMLESGSPHGDLLRAIQYHLDE